MRFFDVFNNRVNPGQFFFGGGASIPKQKDVKMPEPQPVQIPEPVKPLPPPSPAPGESKMEVQDKMMQQRIDAKKRKGVAASLIAGDTGGYKGPTSSATGTGSLLG